MMRFATVGSFGTTITAKRPGKNTDDHYAIICFDGKGETLLHEIQHVADRILYGSEQVGDKLGLAKRNMWTVAFLSSVIGNTIIFLVSSPLVHRLEPENEVTVTAKLGLLALAVNQR